MACFVCDKFLTSPLGDPTVGGKAELLLSMEPFSTRLSLPKLEGAKLCYLPCGHVFHTKCVLYWFTIHRNPAKSKKVDCPTCWTACDESKITKCDLMAIPPTSKGSGTVNTSTSYIAELLREKQELESRNRGLASRYERSLTTIRERDETIKELQDEASQNASMERLRRQALYAEKQDLEQRLFVERHDKEMMGRNLTTLSCALHSVAGNITGLSALYTREKTECDMLRRKVATLEQTTINQHIAYGFAGGPGFTNAGDVPNLRFNSRNVFAVASQPAAGSSVGAGLSSRIDAVGGQSRFPAYLGEQEDHRDE